MMMGTGCVGCIYIGMHIHAKLCNTMQCNTIETLTLLLIWDYVILWWMKRGFSCAGGLDWGRFLLGMESDVGCDERGMVDGGEGWWGWGVWRKGDGWVGGEVRRKG